jgi:hypothetical protein
MAKKKKSKQENYEEYQKDLEQKEKTIKTVPKNKMIEEPNKTSIAYKTKDITDKIWIKGCFGKYKAGDIIEKDKFTEKLIEIAKKGKYACFIKEDK